MHFVSWQVTSSYQVLTPGRGGTHTYQLKCRYLRKTAAFEIIIDPPGKAWLGVNNNKKMVSPTREKVHIKRHIRHLKTYPHKSMGHFGGNDITLVELDRPIFGFQTACLPRWSHKTQNNSPLSPSFDDIREDKDDTILAGYGRYHR